MVKLKLCLILHTEGSAEIESPRDGPEPVGMFPL